jgi:glycine cleavage system H protein
MAAVVPDTMLFSADHQWVAQSPGSPQLPGSAARVRTGMTEYALEAIGDVQYVGLPVIGVQVTSGAPYAEAEASKAVSDLYAAVGGKVVAVNEQLIEQPSLVNSDPYGEGWICEIETVDAESITALLSSTSYRLLTGEEHVVGVSEENA